MQENFEKDYENYLSILEATHYFNFLLLENKYTEFIVQDQQWKLIAVPLLQFCWKMPCIHVGHC